MVLEPHSVINGLLRFGTSNFEKYFVIQKLFVKNGQKYLNYFFPFYMISFVLLFG